MKKVMMMMIMYSRRLDSAMLEANLFPPKGGVSTSVNTRTILIAVSFDYNKHC